MTTRVPCCIHLFDRCAIRSCLKAHNTVVERLKGRYLIDFRYRWKDNIKMGLNVIGCQCVYWIYLVFIVFIIQFITMHGQYNTKWIFLAPVCCSEFAKFVKNVS